MLSGASRLVLRLIPKCNFLSLNNEYDIKYFDLVNIGEQLLVSSH